MALRWYQDDAGDTSMMRIGAMVAVCAGTTALICGSVLSFWSSSGTALAGIGAGLVTSALGFKALQRQAEAKIQ